MDIHSTNCRKEKARVSHIYVKDDPRWMAQLLKLCTCTGAELATLLFRVFVADPEVMGYSNKSLQIEWSRKHGVDKSSTTLEIAVEGSKPSTKISSCFCAPNRMCANSWSCCREAQSRFENRGFDGSQEHPCLLFSSSVFNEGSYFALALKPCFLFTPRFFYFIFLWEWRERQGEGVS